METKYRHELKYTLSQAQLELLRSRVAPLMNLDPNAGSAGSYHIRSLYFDDYHNRYYYENENGTDPREKFRIRIYNHCSQRITLECKRKEKGKTMKSSCPLTLEQTQQLMQGKPLPIHEAPHPLLKRFLIEMQTRMLRPVVIVDYDRIPYVYHCGNVRVTFDTNVSSSSSIQDFFSAELPKRPVMPAGMHLMEVKFDDFLPDFIYRSLNLPQFSQTTYSKYYICRKLALRT